MEIALVINEKVTIEIISKRPRKIRGLRSYTGRIKINSFHERFTMPLTNWKLEDYIKQWKDGLEKIKTESSSCLVATVQNFDKNALIIMWILYKIDTKVIIQNHLLNREIAKGRDFPIPITNFTSSNCYDFITKRLIYTSEGSKISEWEVNLKDI